LDHDCILYINTPFFFHVNVVSKSKISHWH
jgi:hypothetical protein